MEPVKGFIDRGLELIQAAANRGKEARFSTLLTPAQVHAANVQSRYYRNTRATISRLAAETRSESDIVRRAALLRLVRRLGFTTARDVWNAAAGRFGEPLRATFRDVCREAAGAVLAGRPDRG